MPYFFTMRVPVSNSTFIAVSPSNSQARRSASTSATKSTVNGSSLSLYLTYFLKISAGANPVLPTKPATWPLVSESLEINAESVSLVYRDVWTNSQREDVPSGTSMGIQGDVVIGKGAYRFWGKKSRSRSTTTTFLLTWRFRLLLLLLYRMYTL